MDHCSLRVLGPNMWTPCRGCTCANHDVSLASFNTEYTTGLMDNTLHGVLSKNTALLSTDASTISAEILAAQKELLQIQDCVDNINDTFIETLIQAARMPTLIAHLKARQHMLREFVLERRSLLSPVRRLPTEVLHEIFAETVEGVRYKWEVDDSGINKCHVTRPTSSLWSILQVSQFWRSAALSCSRAWSYITIFDADQFDTRDYNDSRRVAYHLEHSRQHPLSVLIYYDPQNTAHHNFPEKLLSSLMHYACRIQRLHLYIPAAAFPQLRPLMYSWKSLQHLSIMPTSFSSLEEVEHRDLPLVDTFANAPNLRDISFMQVLAESQFRLPWRQIRRYYNTTWTTPRVEEILHVLKDAVSIETLNFDSAIDEPLETLVFVTSPLLHTFVYALDTSYKYLPCLLDHLHTPNLSHLELSTSYAHPDPEHTVMPSIIRLIERSHCNLRVLALAGMPISAKELEHIMRLTASLEDLWLTDVGPTALSEATIIKMTATEENSDVGLLLPCLRNLDLEGDWDLNVERFAEMIYSRCRRPSSHRLWTLNVDLANHGCLNELLSKL